MEKAIRLPVIKSISGTVLFDFTVLAFIYFIPAISHLMAFPLYYLDPMRFVLLFALLHTSKRNTFIIALTLPLFSFLISSHPSIIKAGLLSTELLLNVVLFFILFSKTKSRIISLVISVIFSKIIYYVMKYVLIENGVLVDKLFSTPFFYQALVLMIISLYVLIFEKIKSKENN
ncbi:MAG TPA: hypothetical protein VK870_11135 [Ignavibacteriaceae bacterium]|nr:hypothetical protein [Ignavibacteriaceae bacterium]